MQQIDCRHHANPLKHSTAALHALCLPFRFQSQFDSPQVSKNVRIQFKMWTQYISPTIAGMSDRVDQGNRIWEIKMGWVLAARMVSRRWQWCCIFDFIACPYFCPQNAAALLISILSFYVYCFCMAGSFFRSWFFSSHSISHLRPWFSLILILRPKIRKKNASDLKREKKRQRLEKRKKNCRKIVFSPSC